MLLKKKTFTSLTALALALGMGTQTVLASDWGIRVSTGFDYSSGDYGDDTDTDIFFLPVTFKHEREFGAFKLTVPYVSIKSAGGSIGAGGDVSVDPNAGEKRETESGLGDVVFAYTHYAYAGNDNWPIVDLTGKVKFGTADENKGLGTGETDYSVEVDLTKLYDQSVLFVTLGHKFYGDPPGSNLDNANYVSLGAGYQLNGDTSFGLIYDTREASSSSGDDLSEATAYVSHKLTNEYKLLGYLVKGFSDGSADYGIGLSVSIDTDFETLKRYADIPRFFTER